MIDNMTRWLADVADGSLREILRVLLYALGDGYATQTKTSAGLVIKAGGGVLAKTGSAITYGVVKGKLFSIAGSTDMPALAGTVTNAKFNVFCFFQDAAGVRTSAMGVEGATLAAVKFPPFPVGKALIGFIIINPTGTGNFVGNTTPLDDGTVAPNAAYVNNIGPFDPTVLLS